MKWSKLQNSETYAFAANTAVQPILRNAQFPSAMKLMSSGEPNTIRVSVIVPVYNQPDYLAKCLDKLAEQTLPSNQFEVLVIDNGSKEPPSALVAKYSYARFGTESRPGSFAARNTGIQMARGSVVAFTDADCLPDAEWLTAALAAIEGAEPIDVVAGRIDMAARDPAHPTATELFDICVRMDQKKRVAESNGVVTANMVTRRELFESVGLFDDTLLSGADAEWSARAAARGYIVSYVDNAIVVHPGRTTYSEVLRQARRRAGGAIEMHGRRSKRGLASKVVTAVKRLLPKFSGLAEARQKLVRRGYGWWALIRVFAVMQLVHYTSSFEIIRRWCGAPAERR